MKRFGVQLAAGGLVILLGALGVAQAQRDSQKGEADEWDVQAPPPAGPPMPIAAADEPAFASLAQPGPSEALPADPSEAAPAFAQPAFQNAAFAIPADQPGDNAAVAQPQAVRQAAHEDSFVPPPQWSDAAGDEQPSDPQTDAPEDQAAAEPLGFTWPLPAASTGPATGSPAPQPSFAAVAGAAETQSSDSPQTPSPSPAPQKASEQDTAPAASPSQTPATMLPEFAAATLPSGDEAAATGFDSQPLPAAEQPNQSAPAEQPTQASLAEQPAMPFAAGPVNELRDPPALTAAPTSDGPTAYASLGSESALADSSSYGRSAYDEPQYAAEPPVNMAAPTAAPAQAAPPADQAAPQMNFQPLRPIEAPRPAEATLAAQPPRPAEGHLAQSPQAGQPPRPSEAFDNPARRPEETQAPAAATAPAARVASVMPVPLVGLGADSLESILNEPGDRRLEGMQSPSIVIQKRAPEQVQVGKPAAFVIQVQNVGAVEALDVQVHDRVPSGMRLIDASPQPQQHGDVLIWQLGALEPGGERTVSMQLVPEQEGELGSVARVTFEAAASVRTISTRPALKITQRAPQRVLIGQQLEIELEVSNPGTGAATGVIMQEDVPEGLEHPKGRQLDNLIGTLAPGEVRRQVLRLRAVAPGMIENHIRLVGDDGLVAEDRASIEVIAPQLTVELDGPSRRFLERQATYQINLANVGSAEATNVEIVAYLDRGFSFVGTEYQGQYDPTRHAVYWSLAELPSEGRGSVPLTLLPIEQGERAIRLEARGDLNLIARHEKKVNVDALAELSFSIIDDADPIEVGSTATYEVRITNRGSGEDGDVGLKLQLPPGLELVSSDNDASTDGRGLVVFAPQSVMAARSETVHRIRVRGIAPGTHLVKAVVSSRESPVAVTKEESTTVYADQ